MPTLLAAADLLESAATVVIAGDPAGAAPLLHAALSAPDPAITVLQAPNIAALPPDHPAFGKSAGPGCRLCLPPRHLQPADCRSRRPGPGIAHAGLITACHRNVTGHSLTL